MELKKIHISDIGKIVTGKTPRTSVAENYDGYIPFLTPSDDLSHKSAPKTTKTLTEQGLNEVRNCLLPSRSICVSCIGSDLGKVVMTKEPTVTNQQFNSIIPNKNFNADFVYYFMTLVGRELNYLSKTSTAVPIINKSSFSNYEIEVPDLETQNRIVSILSSIDSKIELNRRINDNLEAMAKQLYDYWFVQFDFPNEEGKPYKSSGGAMVWNDKLKRETPSCFEVVNLGNLCDFRNGINYSKDETGNNYQIVNVRNISSSRILLDGEDFGVITVPTSKAENYVLKPDDIIIARSGCPGSTRLLLSPANTLFCGFIICCSPNDSSMRNYLVYCLKQLEGTNATTSGGSILQNVSQDTLKGLHIIVPEKQIIDNFNKTIELIFARMLNCLKESKALTKLRDELLPLLMNGQALVNYHLWNSGIL